MALSCAKAGPFTKAATGPKAAVLRSALPRPSVKANANADKGAARDQMKATGYVAEDNSGKGNIFPTKQQAYMKSGRDQVAAQGLGGFQGIIVLAVILAAVAGATLLEVKAPGPETLATVTDQFSGDSLGTIAARIQASL